MEPDCLLVEGPIDADKQLRFIANEGLEPPVALLIYNVADLNQASYYPFAVFSPEWQAIAFALKRNLSVQFMDLSMAIQFTLDREAKEDRQMKVSNHQSTAEEQRIMRDPLSYMAKIAGYTDSERWWEATFETRENDLDIFPSIAELISVLRLELGRQESARTLLREAHMRKVIRKAVKDGFQRIAVVCGAWHVPALQDYARIKASQDNALLKGLGKTKVNATWIPWSYDRLALRSGYGAGVISPAWYELLFNQREDVIPYWMTKVAILLREQALDASPAHVLEATRLAKSLAILRGKRLPGLDELEAAALSVFCEGDDVQMKLIHNALVIGEKVGHVPPEIPVIPLQKDLESLIKKTRMSKYWGNTEVQWLKATANNPRGGIDLREEADLMKSHLLHRLNILGIEWGTIREGSGNETGTFKEYWQIQWQPDFIIRIIEAGMWGNTVYDAALANAQQRAPEIERLADMTLLVRDILRADLTEAIDPLMQHLQRLAALTQDVFFLMESLPTLVNIIQYGDARKTNIQALAHLISELIPRICIGLPGICLNIDEEMAEVVFNQIVQNNRAIALLNNDDYSDRWFASMQRLATTRAIHERLRGASTRLLFDKAIYSVETTRQEMQLALSIGNSTISIAQWIEGFMHGSGLLLIHHPALWQMLDDWVKQLPMHAFTEVLPLLRRTFTNFNASERHKMMELARFGASVLTEKNSKNLIEPSDRREVVLPTLKLILGLKG
ncbi:MAG: hypothetical protein DHS20C18_06340 [Saprospiraceae bacterium]|nr:MAG: hypothetical protein DHS20C18_06340 [Saprospiraceae bacterium]